MGPGGQDYQVMMNEKVESPFFYVPTLNQKDYKDRTWILLAESKTKIWFYDPYSLSEDEEGILTYDAFIAPREKNNLATYNATIVGPYLQKLDCFSNNQWSETFYTKEPFTQRPLVGDAKPVNGSGWVKISPRTAMAYVRSRLCGRKFIDDQNINYFLYQDVLLDSDNAKPPVFYEVVNNEVTITDSKKDVRQIRISAYFLDKDLTKQADYIFTAHCQENSYAVSGQGQREKISNAVGVKDSMQAVAFNRACGNHGSYMKVVSRGTK